MQSALASPPHSGQITPNDNVDKRFLPKKFKSQITPTLKSQGAGDYSLAGNGLGLGAGGKEKFFYDCFQIMMLGKRKPVAAPTVAMGGRISPAGWV